MSPTGLIRDFITVVKAMDTHLAVPVNGLLLLLLLLLF